jgi:hypothetical protein
VIGYLEVSQGLGNLQLSVYGFDVYRSSPQWEGTPFGGAALPKGNLLAGGFRFAVPAGRTLTITPKAEFRYSRQATGEWQDSVYVEGPVEKAGTSFRFGMDLRQQFTRQFAVVLTGGGIVGSVVQGASDIGLNGYRAGLLVDFTP